MVTDVEHFDFLTGEAVDGEILTERLSRGSLSLEDALRYAIQVGNVLTATHELG